MKVLIAYPQIKAISNYSAQSLGCFAIKTGEGACVFLLASVCLSNYF